MNYYDPATQIQYLRKTSPHKFDLTNDLSQKKIEKVNEEPLAMTANVRGADKNTVGNIASEYIPNRSDYDHV